MWRRVPEPSDVFLLLGQHLKSAGHLAAHISPVAFAELRREAQTNARERAFAALNTREVTLADIYGHLPDTIFTDSLLADKRVSAEIECERDLMVLDEEFVALMKSAKKAGVRVILVSDTYFSSKNINEFLRAAGFSDDGLVDRLFVSCEMGQPKFLDLFDVVLKELGISAGDLIHIGDNPVADIHPCQSRGIASVHYDKWGFSPRVQTREFPETRAGRLALLGSSGDRGLTGLRSRLAHRPPQDISDGLQPYWRYGASVLAPVFAGFARWIAQSCEAAGARLVFGIMREGHFLGRIVELTAQYLGIDLKTEELWLSRRAVIRAALFADDLTLLPEAIALSPGSTKDEVLSGLGLGPAEVDAVFRAPFDLNGVNAIPALSQAIIQTPDLCAKVLEHSAQLRRNLLAGLGKQIDLSQASNIFVMDLGYAATIQSVLTRILAREGARVRLRGMYLALNAKAAANVAGGADIRAYIDHEGFEGQTGALLSRTPDVLEHACMCRDGSLADYNVGGAPVLLPNQRDESQLSQMEAVQRGIVDGLGAVNSLLSNLDATPSTDLHLKKQIAEIIKAALLYPTKQDAETIGAWYHEANFDLSDQRRLSDFAMDTAALEYQGWPALQQVGRGHCYWPAAALALINPFASDVFAAGAGQGYSADHLTSGPMLGSISICPDIGVGFDPKLEGSVPLAVNAFGRGEITAALKPLGAQVYQRLRLQFPKAPALLAIDQFSLIYVGEQEQKTIILDQKTGLERLMWENVAPGQGQMLVAAENRVEARLDLQLDTPSWLHALHIRIRYRYLRAGSFFG